MHSTYSGMPRVARIGSSHTRVGLTDPAVIDAYVERRIADPSLLAGHVEPSYGDFFAVPTA
ncbi:MULTISPECIES: hypothetical protein [unclassified Curtobacterium]|uniref:hypothetical protein n=1 Tax=unclassified Curtobacterium TaxID=257496 RepID=UPI0008DE49BA|nr:MULTISPECIES: hypothetical protein [unclassified Curtobacterium]OIH99648.1 hypothetical protein BIU92_01840 [Curtobacterium sp. MCBA15_003]OII11549.1 hypothetical protein BIU97_06610 [Curtobacterium sp. MCBA15_009]OII30517.1 hypothetical protein BIU94_07055 [Curtobacterium sp. MMLR14_006]